MPGLIIDKVGEGGSIVNNNITYAGPVNNIIELNELPAQEVKDEQRRYVLNENSYFTYNAGNNTWSIVLEPVEKPATPKVYEDPVNDLQELAELPQKDLQDREYRFVTLENKYFFYNGDTNAWEPVSTEVEVPFAPKVKELPRGLKDQQYFITEHGTNDVMPDYLLKRGIIVQTQREFDVASSAGMNLKEVFNRWQMFSHYSGSHKPGDYSEGQVSPPNFPALNPNDPETVNLTAAEFYQQKTWGYDADNDRIFLNKNYHAYTGFISPREFAYYTFEATLSSPNNDDDFMALVIAFWTDPVTGHEHTLSIVRCMIENSGQGDYTYSLIKNFSQLTEETIIDATDLAPYPNGGAGGWSTYGPTRLSVVRAGNTFQIKTSQFGSTEIDDATLISLDLANYPQLEGFTVASRVGFAARSQKDAYFSDIYFSGLTDYIFWPKPGYYDTYEYDQELEEFIKQDPQTVFCKDYFGMNHFVYSYMFDKLYYITERDEIICFKGNEGVSWDADNALSIGSDNKPFLNKADLGSGGTPTITRATIAEMIADQENQNEGQTIKVTDASEDPTVEAGEWYYEYLGTLNATLEDYRKLTESEISTIEAANNQNGGIEIIEETDPFDGVFDKSDGNYHFWPIKDSGNPLGLLQISTTKKVGSQNIVDVKGDMIADVNNFIPNTWRSTGQPITDNSAKVNELRIELLKNNLVAIHNRVFDYLDNEAPTAPTNLTSTSKTDTSISLSWDASNDNVDVVVYNMKAIKVSDNSEITAQSNNTTGAITGLTPEEDYNITVTAEDAAGNISDASNQILVNTEQAQPINDPSTLTNLHIWYDGTDVNSMTLNETDNVESLTDKAGSIDLVKSNTPGPLFDTDKIIFSESSSNIFFLENDVFSNVLLPDVDFHGYFIFKSNSNTQKSFINNKDATAGDFFGIGLRNGNLGVGIIKDGAWQTNKGVPFSNTTNYHKLEFKNKAGVLTAYLDEVEMTEAGTVFSSSSDGFLLGSADQNVNAQKAMDFKSFFVKTGEMTTQEKSNMEAYINAKFNL